MRDLWERFLHPLNFHPAASRLWHPLTTAHWSCQWDILSCSCCSSKNLFSIEHIAWNKSPLVFKAKFLGTVQIEHWERKKYRNLKGRASDGLSYSVFFHLLWNKTWQLMEEAMGRGWFLGNGPTERKMRFQVRMRREKSSQVATHQE